MERVFAASGDLELVGSVNRLNDAVETLGWLQPGIFLIDQTAGTSSILRFISTLKAAGCNSLPVLWASELSEADALRALQLGMRGIVKKTASAQGLIECLREVASGKIGMENSSQIVGFLQRRETMRLTPRRCAPDLPGYEEQADRR